MRIKKLIINIVTGFLCLGLVLGIVSLFSEMRRYESDYNKKEETFLYAIQYKDYPRLLEVSHRNRSMKDGNSERFEEYHGVADYFQAASYYKMYRENNQPQKAEEMKKKMEEAKIRMGKYAYLQEEINQILNNGE